MAKDRREKLISLIEGLKNLTKQYDSEELDLNSTEHELYRLDEEYRKIAYVDDDELSDKFCELYSNLELVCHEAGESEQRMSKPKSYMKRLESLKRMYDSKELEAGQIYLELKKLGENFKKVEKVVDDGFLNQFYELHESLKTKCERDMAFCLKIRRIAKEAKKADYKYKFRIDWTSSEPFDPENEMIDVVLTTQDGQEYWANFTTPKFINYMFEKNKRTGELLSGTYFCMPDNIVILERLTEDNIKATIDDLFENDGVECYFKKISQE